MNRGVLSMNNESPIKIHRITHVGDINDDFVNAIMNIINSLPPDVNVIDLHISSNGGSTSAGITAYNFLKKLPYALMTRNIGNVDSAAILPFLAGQLRTAEDVSRFTFHPATISCVPAMNFVQLDEKMRLLNNDIDEYAAIVSKEAPAFASEHNIAVILRGGTIILDKHEDYYRTGLLTPPEKEIVVKVNNPSEEV